jgi:hypothetical protein
MNYDQSLASLEKRIYDVVQAKTGLPVTIRNASNQKITSQFIELHFVDFDVVGWGEETLTSDDKLSSTQEWEVSVEIACHRGANPSSVLQKLLHCFQSHSALYAKYFNTSDSSYLRCSSIRRRDYPLDKTQWELRSIMTVVFSMVCTEQDVESSGSITTVKFNDGIKTIISENNIIDESLTVTYP